LASVRIFAAAKSGFRVTLEEFTKAEPPSPAREPRALSKLRFRAET
jgi:hypothetical protein